MPTKLKAMLRKLFISLSIITAVVVSVIIGLDSWKDIYIPILILIGSYIGYIILYFFIVWLISLTINTKKEYDKPNRFYKFLTVKTMEMISNYAGVKLKVVGKELVPNNEKYMLVFNHCSKFDPIIQSYILNKNNLVHISKPSNFKVPIAGPFIKRCGYMPIDRENNKSGLKTILRAIHLIEEGIASVGVSPEGKRNYQDGLLPFKNGCFKIALKAKCPIVICTMRNTAAIHKNFPFKKTKVEMRIVKVLSYDEIKDLNTNEISDLVRKIMCEDLEIMDEQIIEIENQIA